MLVLNHLLGRSRLLLFFRFLFIVCLFLQEALFDDRAAVGFVDRLTEEGSTVGVGFRCAV